MPTRAMIGCSPAASFRGRHQLLNEIRLNDDYVGWLSVDHLFVDDRRQAELDLHLMTTIALERLSDPGQGRTQWPIAQNL